MSIAKGERDSQNRGGSKKMHAKKVTDRCMQRILTSEARRDSVQGGSKAVLIN